MVVVTCKQLLSGTAQSIKINHKFIFWALVCHYCMCHYYDYAISLSPSQFFLFLAQAFSAFFYTHSFLEKAAGITITSRADLEKATRVVCNMSIQEVPPC